VSALTYPWLDACKGKKFATRNGGIVKMQKVEFGGLIM
jgi:hypothetical protein